MEPDITLSWKFLDMKGLTVSLSQSEARNASLICNSQRLIMYGSNVIAAPNI